MDANRFLPTGATTYQPARRVTAVLPARRARGRHAAAPVLAAWLALAATAVAQSSPAAPDSTAAPAPTPAPAGLPRVLVIPHDSAGGDADSVRVILERDFAYGDRLTPVVLDSVSRAQLFAAANTDSVFDELALYEPEFAMRVTREGDEGGRVRVSVFNVPEQRVVRRATFPLSVDSSGVPDRMQLHQIADEAQRWMTGAAGIAATRVAYVQGTTLHVIDSDGASDTAFATQGVALSPDWHPSGTSLVYMDMREGGTRVARIDLTTGKTRFLQSARRGFNITPVFTADGGRIAYAILGQRGSRIVLVNADGTGREKALIEHVLPGMRDMAEPTFSPDGKEAAFVASLPTYPQVYTVRLRDGKIRRFVPFTPGLRNERTAPDWSPDGTMIAFQQQNRKFQIWVARVRDGVADSVRRVTSVAENENPSWAPDSRHMVVTSIRGGTKVLWVFDTLTERWRQLTTAPGARLAAWSGRLKGKGAQPLGAAAGAPTAQAGAAVAAPVP